MGGSIMVGRDTLGGIGSGSNGVYQSVGSFPAACLPPCPLSKLPLTKSLAQIQGWSIVEQETYRGVNLVSLNLLLPLKPPKPPPLLYTAHPFLVQLYQQMGWDENRIELLVNCMHIRIKD